MAFVTLINQDATSMSCDQLVFSAQEVQALKGIDALHQSLSQRVQKQEQDIREAMEKGYHEGYSKGLKEAEAEGREALATQLAENALALDKERCQLRDSVVALALQVVQKIAVDIGADKMVASLAATAAQEMIPEGDTVLYVNPEAIVEVQRAVSGFEQFHSPGVSLSVKGDETLALHDCIFESPLGSTVASLDYQLAALEKILMSGVYASE
jgi:flagellar biosynthesis/type III secretory pathway protein FliH